MSPQHPDRATPAPGSAVPKESHVRPQALPHAFRSFGRSGDLPQPGHRYSRPPRAHARRAESRAAPPEPPALPPARRGRDAHVFGADARALAVSLSPWRPNSSAALRPRPRSDRGRAKQLTPEQRSLVLDIRREHRSASVALAVHMLLAHARRRRSARTRRHLARDGAPPLPRAGPRQAVAASGRRCAWAPSLAGRTPRSAVARRCLPRPGDPRRWRLAAAAHPRPARRLLTLHHRARGAPQRTREVDMLDLFVAA